MLAGLLAAGRHVFATPPAPPPGETAEAREQARLCERLNLEEGVAACRAALALGIGPARRAPVRQMLARHLVLLEDWEGLAEHFREDVNLDPESAVAWQRLGATLFFALDKRTEAIAAFEQAVHLAPDDAETYLALGLALAADGRQTEASHAFREALRLDPQVLVRRPAARTVLEALDEGQPWP